MNIHQPVSSQLGSSQPTKITSSSRLNQASDLPPPSPYLSKKLMEREQIVIDPFKAPSVVLFIRAFTLWSIWPSILFFTGFATLVALIDDNLTRVRLSPTILTVLGTVIGFVVSYRTSSAYERYNDGRKQWSSITLAGRTLSRLIWIHCPNVIRIPDSNNPLTPEEILRGMIEKKTTINLMMGFAIALKHYLRGEHGIYYADLYHLVCFLPRYSLPSGHPIERPDLGFQNEFNPSSHPTQRVSQTYIPDPNLDISITINDVDNLPTNSPKAPGPHHLKPPSHCSTSSDPRLSGGNGLEPPQELLPAYNPPKSNWFEVIPFLTIFRSLWKGTQNAAGYRDRKNSYRRRIHDDNIPLEIIWCIDSYIATLRQRKVVDVPTMNALLATVLSLSDALTSLDRILTTPIPFGYIVHLKLVIWGYLTFLPFQLLGSFGFITIPAVALVSIAFLGFLRVGEEIENPFGYDSNDLDMDHFCHNIIAKELAEITAWPPPDPTEFYFSRNNLPLIEAKDGRSSSQILNSNVSPEDFQFQLRSRVSSRNY